MFHRRNNRLRKNEDLFLTYLTLPQSRSKKLYLPHPMRQYKSPKSSHIRNIRQKHIHIAFEKNHILIDNIKKRAIELEDTHSLACMPRKIPTWILLNSLLQWTWILDRRRSQTPNREFWTFYRQVP